jgi:membrane protease YdiL (CAAX protease family)
MLVCCAFLHANQLDVQPITVIAAKAKPTLFFILAVSILNGLYEETFLLGYLVRGFSAAGASFAVGLSILVRLLYHLYQGPVGAVSVVVFGLIVSYYYWRTPVLWPAVLAHTIADVIGLAHI